MSLHSTHPILIRSGLLLLLGIRWILLQPVSMVAQSNPDMAILPSEFPSSDDEGPKRLKREVRVTVETNLPPSTAQANGVAAAKRTFQWKFKWEAWNGLNIAISKKTPIEDPLAKLRTELQGAHAHRIVHLEELKMSGKIGAKFALDGAAYVTGDGFENLDAGAELRRARIYAKGDCLLVLPVSYQLELGYIPHQFYIEESYLAFRNIAYIGQLKFGQYQAPMGLDIVTSSRDISFMEPAGPMQALAPGVSAGVQVGQSVLRDRATWSLGVFTDGVGEDFGDASRDYGRAVVRLTGLPIDQHRPTAYGSDERAHLLHLGLSANILYSANSTVRYRTRPESHLAPHVVDTGDIPSQGAVVVGTEAAWVNGPFSVQGEFLHSFVAQASGPRLDFRGFYASANWFLTGESRPYDRADGCFGRVIPRRNFNWGRGGWGAWEIGSRYSFVDLDDGDIDGGRLRMLMIGLNWYPHSHVKWRFNYGFGHVSDREPDGNLNVFQTRVEVDW